MWLWLMWSLSPDAAEKKTSLKPHRLEHRHILPYFVWIRHFSVAKPGFYTHRLLCGHSFHVHIGVGTETDIESFLHSLQGSPSLKQFYQFIFSPIPLAPICLNPVHFNCWPHEDESKRIPFFTVAQNHAAALYWIKSLDIKHITDWGGKKAHHTCTAQSVVIIFSFPCQYGLMWIIYIPRTNS